MLPPSNTDQAKPSTISVLTSAKMARLHAERPLPSATSCQPTTSSTSDSTVQSRKSGLSSSTPTPKLSMRAMLGQLVSSRPCQMCSSQLPVSPIYFARFFNKQNSEITSIVLACDGSTDEKCKGYTRAQNMPYAGDSTGTSRWTNTGISNGDARGDAFWVNHNDNA